MPKFPAPPPPDRLRTIKPDIRRLPSGTLLARIYARGGHHGTTWRSFRFDGPLAGRFDHHDPTSPTQRGVLYGALDVATCVAEVFQATRVVDRFAHDRCLTAFEATRPIALLDLTGDWPTRAGASQAIASGARPRAQHWARTIYDAYPKIQGIWYPSSIRGSHPAFVLFDRAQPALAADPAIDVPISHPGLLPDLVRIANKLGYLLQ